MKRSTSNWVFVVNLARVPGIAVLLLAFGALCTPALAASGTWSSTAATGAWGTASNWLSSNIPGGTSGPPYTNADTATFNSASSTVTINPDINRNLEFITFDTGAVAYTISNSNSLVLTSGGTIQIAGTFNGSNITETVNAPLMLEGSYTFADNTSNAGDQLLFGGAITSGAAGTQTLTVSGTDNTTINGAIGGGTGMIALLKNGGGKLILSGSNTFTGGINISAGVLQVGSAGALNSNVLTFGGAATLSLAGNAAVVSNLTTSSASAVIQNASATPAMLTLSNFANTFYQGTIQDGAGGGALSLVKSGSQSLALFGPLSITGGVTVQTGQLQISGINTFTGGVTISGGTLLTTNSGALNASAPNAVTFSSGSTGLFSIFGTSITIGDLNSNGGSPVIDNESAMSASLTVNANGPGDNYDGVFRDGTGQAGTLALNKNGTGNLTLSGNNTFTGGVTINAGELIVNSTGALNSTSPNAVAFGAGSTGFLILNGFNLTVSGLNTNATVGFPSVQNAVGTPVTFTVNNATANTFAGVLTDGAPGSGALSLTKNGAGTLTLSGANDYTGATTINGGTLRGGATNTFPANSAFTVDDVGILNLGGFSQSIGSLINDVGGAVTTLGTTGTDTLTVGNSNASTGFSGTISNAAGGRLLALTKVGTGTFTLSGQNTFTGPLTVNGGTLALSGGSLAANVANNAALVYNAGTFNGRLINDGTVTLNADFTAGNGMENDAFFSVSSGRVVTLGGAGLDNEGTLTMAGGTLNLSTSGSTANVNHGTFNLSPTIPFNLNGATLTNGGTLNLDGGTVNGAGLLSNIAGGVVSGPGAITGPFSNAGGVLLVNGGNMNIAPAFTNTGAIQLTTVASNLVGGTITNSGTINGVGTVGNALINAAGGTLEPLGNVLYVSGTLQNQAGGLVRAGAGSKLVVVQGLTTNAGVVYMAGGTLDNNGHGLNNAGQISGFGIFSTGGTGLDNNGSITFSGGLTTVNGPLTNENGKTIVVAYNPAIFTGLVTNNGGGTFNIVSTSAVFAGGSSGTFSGTFTNNANSAFSVGGSGVLEVDGAPTLGASSSMAVGGTSTLRFKPTSGSASVATGVTASVAAGATLELAGTVSGLSSGSNRVNVTNNSSSAGILVSGTNQQVGNIDGSGTTQVNAGGDLTANHIIQTALAIGGTSSSHGLVTIDASDASGNPLAETGVGGSRVAAGGLSSAPLGDGSIVSDPLPPSSEGFSGDPILAGPAGDGGTPGSNSAAVPEPSSTLLIGAAGLAFTVLAMCRRRLRSSVHDF
jgi:autotransporter-associated beta strand protein